RAPARPVSAGPRPRRRALGSRPCPGRGRSAAPRPRRAGGDRGWCLGVGCRPRRGRTEAVRVHRPGPGRELTWSSTFGPPGSAAPDGRMGRPHRVGACDVVVPYHATPGVHDVQREPDIFSRMHNLCGYDAVESCSMRTVDDTDRRLLLAMTENPRSTIVALAERLGLSRNTVQSRLAALEAGQA